MESSPQSETTHLPEAVPEQYLKYPISAKVMNRYWQDTELVYLYDAVLPTLESLSGEELYNLANQFHYQPLGSTSEEMAMHLEEATYEHTSEDLWQGAEKWQGEQFANNLILNQLPDEAFRRLANRTTTNPTP